MSDTKTEPRRLSAEERRWFERDYLRILTPRDAAEILACLDLADEAWLEHDGEELAWIVMRFGDEDYHWNVDDWWGDDAPALRVAERAERRGAISALTQARDALCYGCAKQWPIDADLPLREEHVGKTGAPWPCAAVEVRRLLAEHEGTTTGGTR